MKNIVTFSDVENNSKQLNIQENILKWMKYISFERSESRLLIEVDRQKISSDSDEYVTSEKYNDVIRNVVYLK